MDHKTVTKNPLEAYGAWLAGVGDEWPEEASHSAHREFIDTVAVMVPGAAEPATRKAFGVVKDWGTGPCAVVGRQLRLAAPWAALVNGTAGHALDFDDNFDPPKAHASTVLVPAILALGEQEGVSGGACLDAYIVGLQIMGRVGQGVNPYHRNRGWHATATVGAIGAAAACARLLRLNAQEAAYALSISTSMAAGFMSQFGTMTKPLHAGLAAKGGVMAASFARAGMTAGMGTLDGRTGLNRLMVGPDYEELRDGHTNPEHGQTMRYELDSIGEPLLITEHGFRVKRFPTCGVAHRGMDALLELLDAHDFAADDVAQIDVHAPRVHFNNLMHEDPVDPLQAKFSMEYGLASILLTGDCRLSDFTQAAVMRPEVWALYPNIHRHPVDKPEGEFPTQVKVTLKDGRLLEAAVGLPKGSKVAPFSDEEYLAKYDACVEGLLSLRQSQDLKEALQALDKLSDIADLTKHMVWQLADAA